MRPEAGARVSPDIHVRTERARCALSVARRRAGYVARGGGHDIRYGRSPADELNDGPIDVDAEVGEGRAIGIWTNTDDHVSRDVGRKQSNSGELSKSSLQLVPRHGRMAEPWNDQPDACARPWRTHERGSGGPNLKVRGSETLPLLRDTLQFRASRDACTPRKAG
jgi:hypothetical protein